MDTWIKTVLLAALASLLSACASTKEEVVPQNGPTMQQIYEHHMQQSGAESRTEEMREDLDRPVAPGKGDLKGYTRQASNEIEQLFPLLPNPQMVLYIFPHLSAEGAPVPGYATAFPMYPVDQYALPGEVYQP
jgi:conjugative transfer region lipoprotein (TIGR03751 family)